MADVATPTTDATSKGRPEKPDEAKYKADLAKAEKDHEAAQARFNAARAKIDAARGSGPNAPNDRFKELVEEQKSIRDKQKGHKEARASQVDKLNRNDAEIKKLIAEQKDQRSRSGFKSADEIDNRIASLEKQVDSGQMKLVDEKKTLEEIRGLRRQKKNFAGLDEIQKKIDVKKTENADLKKTIDTAESRALGQKYEDNQKELDEIKSTRESSNRNMDSLKADRERLYNEQQETYQAIRKIKDNYFQGRKAYKVYEDQVWEQRRERQRAERQAYEKEKRRKIAESKLEEASEPAFLDEIRTAEGLIKHFDPSYATSEGDSGPGKFAASAQRTIDDSGFKGMKVAKKVEEDFFVGSGGKKKGKGKKGNTANGAAPESAGKFNMNIGIIEELAKVGVDPPSTQADVPNVVEKLKEKLEAWKKDQKSQTEKNVEKAKKEIERLEKEADEVSSTAPAEKSGRRDRAKKTAQNNAEPTAEAERDQEKDAVDDAAKELEAAKLEDSNQPDISSA